MGLIRCGMFDSCISVAANSSVFLLESAHLKKTNQFSPSPSGSSPPSPSSNSSSRLRGDWMTSSLSPSWKSRSSSVSSPYLRCRTEPSPKAGSARPGSALACKQLESKEMQKEKNYVEEINLSTNPLAMDQLFEQTGDRSDRPVSIFAA